MYLIYSYFTPLLSQWREKIGFCRVVFFFLACRLFLLSFLVTERVLARRALLVYFRNQF